VARIRVIVETTTRKEVDVDVQIGDGTLALRGAQAAVDANPHYVLDLAARTPGHEAPRRTALISALVINPGVTPVVPTLPLHPELTEGA
jgi:hypothetical protein